MPIRTLNLDPDRPCTRGHVGNRYPNGRCKTCILTRVKDWKLNNPDRVKLSNRESIRRKRLSDVEAARQRARLDRRAQYAKRRDEILAANREWRKANRSKVKLGHARWRKGKCRSAEVAVRRASKKNATPAWADPQRIKEVYRRAERLGECLKIKVNVDHIVPLQSEFVCGLHVPWNLQIISRAANLQKHNRVWPDMTVWS